MRVGSRRFDGWTAVAVVLTLGYLLVAVWPLLNVLVDSIFNGTEISFSGFVTFFTAPRYFTTLVNSMAVTITVTVLSLLVAFPLAYFMTMYKIFGNRIIQVLILASMMSPPFIGAYSWILLLGNNGMITKWLSKSLGIEFPSIYGFGGIVLVLTLQLVPLIFTYLMGAWKTVDVSLLEASESMGVVGMKRAVKVILPLLWPTVLAGSLLVFVRAFADFGTPMLIGQGYQTVPVLIYNAAVGEVSTDTGFAAAVSVVVMALTLAVFLIQRWIASRKTFSMNAMRPIEPTHASWWRALGMHAYIYVYLLLALAPLLVVVGSSFRKTIYGQFTDGWGVENYTKASRDMWKLIGNTFELGLSALVILVIVAVLVSYLTVRRKGWLSSTLDTMTMVPYVVPGLVIGIGLIAAFSKPPLMITGTAAIMVIALMIRRVTYSVRSVTALMYQVPPSVEEAAMSLGASKFRTLTRIVVPALAPGILSGAVLSWVTIITELSTTLFLYTTKTQTLSLGIYSSVIRGQLGTAAALSTVLLTLTALSLVLLMRLPGGTKNLQV
ncbi:iron ABC transporter permease [Microbacterium protaetiae]|uniref:Iron ABC transporter permease n=1 Tax=Microbacterium protaetiae TaxID=2509458 RepID=A0A4V0YD56_9MICO|nr:iron ABC transporter permease [Microbacterium protaetiae]QAY59541.1 iron ABC transporter permease [Microbacterium protaetiae]